MRFHLETPSPCLEPGSFCWFLPPSLSLSWAAGPCCRPCLPGCRAFLWRTCHSLCRLPLWALLPCPALVSQVGVEVASAESHAHRRGSIRVPSQSPSSPGPGFRAAGHPSLRTQPMTRLPLGLPPAFPPALVCPPAAPSVLMAESANSSPHTEATSGRVSGKVWV